MSTRRRTRPTDFSWYTEQEKKIHEHTERARELRRQFIAELVLPGLIKLVASCRPRDLSPWLTLVEAAGLLCSADCQEVATC